VARRLTFTARATLAISTKMTTYKTTTSEASGHWYDRTGMQVATVLSSDLKEIKPTLRQARKLDLVPGVTTIIKEAHKEQLVMYRERQVLLASLTLGRKMSETDDDFISRIMRDAKEAAFQAADKGSQIHARVEHGLHSRESGDEWVLAVREQLSSLYDGDSTAWRCERPCVHPYGYGTKSDLSLDVTQADLHSGDIRRIQWVVDMKTKDGNLDNVTQLYIEHSQQLAATAHALEMPNANGAILYVSRTEPTAKLVIATQEEMEHGWATFCALLNYWQVKNKYAPSWAKRIY
jgi:hypothetical protein